MGLVPLAVGTSGSWSKEAHYAFSSLLGFIVSARSRFATTAEVYGTLNLVLMRAEPSR